MINDGFGRAEVLPPTISLSIRKHPHGHHHPKRLDDFGHLQAHRKHAVGAGRQDHGVARGHARFRALHAAELRHAVAGGQCHGVCSDAKRLLQHRRHKWCAGQQLRQPERGLFRRGLRQRHFHAEQLLVGIFGSRGFQQLQDQQQPVHHLTAVAENQISHHRQNHVCRLPCEFAGMAQLASQQRQDHRLQL